MCGCNLFSPLYVITLCVFQAVMLDVLIIGGGPHALTLASLLSSHNPDPNSDHERDPPISHNYSDQRSQPRLETSSNKCSSGKRKKMAAVGTVYLFKLTRHNYINYTGNFTTAIQKKEELNNKQMDHSPVKHLEVIG